jgi:putative NADH-flavin reductase
MRLLVLGANGRTGIEVIDLALARGHEVTAFVRSPKKIARADAKLRVVEGDPHDAALLASALAGHDAVLSALGPRPREAMTRTTLLGDCTASTVEAMRRASTRRLLVVSSALLFPGGGVGAGFFRWLIRSHVRDCAAMEEQLRASALDWTIARPPRLVDARYEEYRAEDDALPGGMTLGSQLSWRAVATFLIDAVDDARYVRKTVGICR